MRGTERTALINKALEITERLHPASLTFEGFPPVTASRRASAATQTLRLGGFTKSAPSVFLIRRENIPPGLSFRAKATKFRDAFDVPPNSVEYRVDAIDDEKREPHIRLTTNLADR